MEDREPLLRRRGDVPLEGARLGVEVGGDALAPRALGGERDRLGARVVDALRRSRQTPKTCGVTPVSSASSAGPAASGDGAPNSSVSIPPPVMSRSPSSPTVSPSRSASLQRPLGASTSSISSQPEPLPRPDHVRLQLGIGERLGGHDGRPARARGGDERRQLEPADVHAHEELAAGRRQRAAVDVVRGLDDEPAARGTRRRRSGRARAGRSSARCRNAARTRRFSARPSRAAARASGVPMSCAASQRAIRGEVAARAAAALGGEAVARGRPRGPRGRGAGAPAAGTRATRPPRPRAPAGGARSSGRVAARSSARRDQRARTLEGRAGVAACPGRPVRALWRAAACSSAVEGQIGLKLYHCSGAAAIVAASASAIGLRRAPDLGRVARARPGSGRRTSPGTTGGPPTGGSRYGRSARPSSRRAPPGPPGASSTPRTSAPGCPSGAIAPVDDQGEDLVPLEHAVQVAQVAPRDELDAPVLALRLRSSNSSGKLVSSPSAAIGQPCRAIPRATPSRLPMWAVVRIRPLPVDFQYASSGSSVERVDQRRRLRRWSVRGRRISSTT